jgi:leucyl aminopeptidase
MKITALSALALSATFVSARFVEQHESDQVVINAAGLHAEQYLIELSPGETRYVTEDEKWELRRVSYHIPFFAQMGC